MERQEQELEGQVAKLEQQLASERDEIEGMSAELEAVSSVRRLAETSGAQARARAEEAEQALKVSVLSEPHCLDS